MVTQDEILLLQLHKIGSQLLEAEGLNLKARLKTVMESARKMLSFTRAVLYIENNNMIEVKVAVGKFSLVAKSFRWPKDAMGGVTWVFKTGKPMLQKGLWDKRLTGLYPKKKSDYDILFTIFKMVHLGQGDIALAPVYSQGKVIGVFGADKLGKPITKSDLKHLQDFASQAGWAFEKIELSQKNKALLKDLKKSLEHRTQELKRLQEKLVHAERLAAMGELVAGVAHEIKNPLMGIVGFTDLLKTTYTKDEEARQIISGLSFSVKHLQSVVKNFLSFSKNTKPVLGNMNLNKAVSDALTLTEHQLQGMKVKTELKIDHKLPLIKGDHNQLVQVFTNIIINAAHAMEPKGGGPLLITSGAEDGYVFVKFSDKGVGIPENIQDKIFQSFFTTKPKGKGTGLGLSISLGIIENHKGKILVTSEVNIGTTFTVLLPIKK